MNGSTADEQWERSYREEAPRVYRALLATLQDREAARDALHEAFAEGLQHPPQRGENLTGWLFRVALRKGRRQILRSGLRRVANWIDQGAGDDELDRTLDRLEVGRLLRLLTKRQRAIVVAQYYLGLRQAEIARAFRIREGTVSATVAQALARMRKVGQGAD